MVFMYSDNCTTDIKNFFRLCSESIGSPMTIGQKKSPKNAIILISSKYGAQYAYMLTQTLSDFQLKHLNLVYMTIFNFNLNQIECK